MYNLIKQQWDSDKINCLKEFKVVLLNRSNQVLGVVDISMGGINRTFDPEIVFAIALKGNSSILIPTYNHPNGSVRPSEADIKLTNDW